MGRPRLYICFGVPKSGSTLAYQLTRAAAARSGFDQSALSESDTVTTQANAIDGAPDVFAETLAAAERAGRHMVVVKTHADPTEAVAEAARTGQVLIQVHARDPRDVALSMCDAAKRGDSWGGEKGGPAIRRPEDTLPRIRRLVRRHNAWASLPGALCLSYEQTAFSPLAAARKIAKHMGVRAAPLRDAFVAKRRFTQFNQGRSQRYLAEMDTGQREQWYLEFKDHIGTYCPPPDGALWPSRLGTFIGRGLRKLR